MDIKKVLFIILFLLITGIKQSYSQKWNGKQCAVVLTYDDATNSQLDNVIPLLDSLGLKATFFLPGQAKTLQTRLKEWRQAASKGHELGNHTLFHPCHGKSKKRKWIKPDYDLDNYSIKRYMNEIKVHNAFLHAIDGQTKRTFAYTCGDKEVDNQNVIPLLKKYFIAARGVERGLNYMNNLDLYNLKIFGSHGKITGDDLIEQVKKAKEKGALLIFLFHDVDNKGTLFTDPQTHRELVKYLAEHQNNIWVAPLREVIEYYNSTQK
jgi:sialate O-acetylesterase